MSGEMPEIGVTMPGLGTRLDRFAEFAVLAEEAGFDAVWDYEFWRNPFTIHMTTAAATERIPLATGVAAAFSRSPYELANAAADVDELSGGRLILGIGPGALEFLEWFHSVPTTQVAARMSEYLDVVRMSWDQLHTQDPSLSYEGEHYRFTSPPFNPWGGRELVRTRIPIFLAAMKPKMMQLAGEKADGWIGYMSPPDFLNDHVKKHLAIGAARAGRDPATIRLASETICSVHEDRDVAMHRARIQVGLYVCNHVSNAIVEFAGLQEDRDAVLNAVMQRGLRAAAEVTSDALVDTLSITGTPDECRDKIAAFAGVLDHVILHTPYVPPLRPDETEDAYRWIVRTFDRSVV
jgi:alkanesulfonate monooxygenase SsuD/methylene tetrahydromethanopterin reductase-like flavin-dependent oxidoreductase (luciferase family)